MTQGLAHPGGEGRWGSRATNDSGGEGHQRQKGGKVQAEPSQPVLGIRGSPCCVHPPVCAGAPARAGRGGRQPLSALQQALGSQAVLRSWGKWPRGDTMPGGSRKVGPLFLPGPPSRQGALFLVSAPKRGGEGLGVGPCHPGLFSGQELGIKIDYGGRNWGGRELRTHAEGPWSSVPMGSFISPSPLGLL